MDSFKYFAVCVGFLLFVSEVYGHSYLTNPISRSDQKQTLTGCRGPACLGPCDIPLASAHRAPITIARGDTINPQWPRNNHAGGFIRFSWAPTQQSDDAAVFDAGVDSVFCHEIGGCGPSDPSNPNGGDTNPSDGSYLPCQTNITVPAHLADGTWTLQWAWFGGAFSLGDYYSCVDYTISGGVALGAANPGLFHGGDYSNPNNHSVCKFFNTDRLHQCIDEPCNNPLYPAQQQQTGPAFGFAVAEFSAPDSNPTQPINPATGSNSATGSATGNYAAESSSTTGASYITGSTTGSESNNPAEMTTGEVTSAAVTSATVTSGAMTSGSVPVSMTTGSIPAHMTTHHNHHSPSKPVTTSAQMPSQITSGAINSENSPSTTSSDSNDSNSCTLGYMKCLTSETYSTCAHNVWGVSQSCQYGLTCHPSGNYIYCY